MPIVWTNILTAILVGFYLYTLLSTITVVILENRNPIRSIAWVVALVFLPFLGLFFYLVFGQNFRQKKKIQKLSIQRLQVKETEPFDVTLVESVTSSTNVIGLIRLLFNNNQALAYENSKIDIYTSGKETFDAIFQDMENAKNHIHIEFYIIANDKLGNRLRELLIRKAQQGVRVRLIYDYWGSFYLGKKYLQSMKDAGVLFHAFFPPRFPFFLSKLNYRNHRKLVLVDGLVAYTGGLNMADRYLTGDLLGQWRDTMIRIEGSAVYGLQETFLSDWYFVDRKMITDKKYFPVSTEFSKNLIQIVDCGPDTEWMSIMHGIYFAITTATKYVYIQTPYFMPTEVILAAIQTAALRGVDVRLMIPQKSDTSMARSSNHSYVQLMFDAGVKVYSFQNGFLHSKTIVIDDLISTIGTSNMDFRSFEQNFEVNAFIYDKDTALELKSIFLTDIKSSVEINEDEWKKRKKMEKIRESIARLFSPMM